MSILSGLRALLKIGGAASNATEAAATVTKAGKTIINVAKDSKVILQLGEVGGAAAKTVRAGFLASRAWVFAKWGIIAAAVIGVGVGVKNILSGLFGSAYDGLSSVLEGFGLSSEQADTGASVIFIALFVAVFLYALPYIIDRVPKRRPRPTAKNTEDNSWMTFGQGERR